MGWTLMERYPNFGYFYFTLLQMFLLYISDSGGWGGAGGCSVPLSDSSTSISNRYSRNCFCLEKLYLNSKHSSLHGLVLMWHSVNPPPPNKEEGAGSGNVWFKN